jgi:CheY-like chemotaxis protein
MFAQNPNNRTVVLVVDDEKLIADTVSAILRLNGMDTLSAYDAESAIDIARSTPPDLLLSDVVMPGKTGIELAIAVRSLNPQCRILLFSGQAATLPLMAEAHAAGNDFKLLQKPIHPKDLLEHISTALQN